MTRWLFLVAIGTAVAPLAAGCNTSAVGVSACKQIEEARCRAAASCPDISLARPYAASGSQVDACIRYYDIDCLHGLAISSEPTDSEVQQCVTAIETDGCATVQTPQSDPPCAWLGAAEDAGADVVDAAADVVDGEAGSDGD